MGYYTDYKIVKASDDARVLLESVSGYDWGDGEMNGKWYHWKEHLELVSAEFPDETIVLEGVGEEHPDIWRAYARAGEVTQVQAEFTYPPDPYAYYEAEVKTDEDGNPVFPGVDI